MTRLPVFAGCALVWLLAGCGGIKGTVINRSQFEIKASRLKLSPNGHLKVLHGEAVRMVPLKQVRNLEITPTDSRTFNRQFYYPAVLTLDQGESIDDASFRQQENGRPRTFVCIDGQLSGKTENGRFTLTLDKISKLVIE